MFDVYVCYKDKVSKILENVPGVVAACAKSCTTFFDLEPHEFIIEVFWHNQFPKSGNATKRYSTDQLLREYVSTLKIGNKNLLCCVKIDLGNGNKLSYSSHRFICCRLRLYFLKKLYESGLGISEKLKKGRYYIYCEDHSTKRGFSKWDLIVK